MSRAVLAASLLAAALAGSPASFAQPPSLQASVDRATLHANESFTYVLRAEGQLRGEPDLRALEADFDVLDRSRTTRIQIINGQTAQVAEWFLQLMPRAAGRYTLPPAELGGARSNALDIEVLPPLAGEAPGDIFVEVEASPATVYVQSQVVYTLRVFRSVSTGRATLSTPQIGGAEAIVEQLGQDREYQTVRDGRSFIVREQRFAVFPQQTGLVTIEPVTFEAVVVAPSGFSSLQRFHSDAVQFRVEAPVPPPAEFASAAWLPARSLTLVERWSNGGVELTVGVPATRTVIVEADGLLDTQLPELALEQTERVKQYADQPELGREVSPEGLRSRRLERFAVIAQAPGELALPAVELPWWNVTERRWEVARLAARTLRVLPSEEQSAATAAPSDAPAAAPAGSALHLWPAVSALLLAAWLATLVLWWRSRRSAGANASAGAPAAFAGGAERRLRQQLREACRADDAAGARRLLLEWGAACFPDDRPRSLGALAARLPQPLAAELAALEANAFGHTAEPWHGAVLAAALAGSDVTARRPRQSDEEKLLPLYR